MSNLNQAREWAESVGNIEGLMPGTRATVEVVQSLPDRWVDAEEVKAIIAGMNCCLTQGSETNFRDGFKEATTTWRDALEALLTPKLPTLADMTAEERLACQFMQARLEDGTLGIIVCPGDPRSCVILEDGGFFTLCNKSVTPLQGEPKLKWPGSELPALPEGMRLADHEKFGRVVTSPWVDGDDDYKIFFLIEDARGGADYDFAHESELTFLDGDE